MDKVAKGVKYIGVEITSTFGVIQDIVLTEVELECCTTEKN